MGGQHCSPHQGRMGDIPHLPLGAPRCSGAGGLLDTPCIGLSWGGHGPASSSAQGGCHCQGRVLWGGDTPGRAGRAWQPPGLLAALGSLVQAQPPTAVKMFFSLAGRSQPTRSPTRDVAPICCCLLGRQGHPGSPPPPVGTGLGHAPTAPSPPAHGIPPARAAPAPLFVEQGKGPPLIFIKPLIRRLSRHHDGGDVAAGGALGLIRYLCSSEGLQALAQGRRLHVPSLGSGVFRRGPGLQTAPSAPALGVVGGSSCPAARWCGNCCKAKA